ncbi:hypothetical protein C8F04DRAFT_1365358 [Mycena alexandri]|uniref:Uncharacterized protein n=1 Tax=Mycena alexandri TaxID=1745969 RepID=A0AAD6WZB0_9AGAR|nr:hypothetical protein C8F04DRAFT_1365358 [Mycena alexandri]
MSPPVYEGYFFTGNAQYVSTSCLAKSTTTQSNLQDSNCDGKLVTAPLQSRVGTDRHESKNSSNLQTCLLKLLPDLFVYPAVRVNHFNVSFDFDMQVVGLKLSYNWPVSMHHNDFRSYQCDFFGTAISRLGKWSPDPAVPEDVEGDSDADWKAWSLQNFVSVDYTLQR